MENTIIAYYSHNGSNKYLATKLAADIDCNIIEIKPRISTQIFVMMSITLGFKKITTNLSEYNKVIVCGPIWMGKLIAPLKWFITKYKTQISDLIFITCCGSGFEKKDEKFGHELVFDQVKSIYPSTSICQAFPITLLIPNDKKDDSQLIMKTRLNNETFTGEIVNVYNAFLKIVSPK